MTNQTLHRRELLRGAVVHLAVIGTAPVLLQACKSEELVCDDTSGLEEADVARREQLGYRDQSPHPEVETCSNCAFYVVARKNECGKCTLVRGPIHPRGYCTAWSKKV